jgi:hypothetical protein
VPHAGEDDPHNECADKVPPNRYPGNDVLVGGKRSGGQSMPSSDTRRDKGLEVQRRLLGEKVDQMYAQSPKDQLHIQEFLTANCFGDYLTRTDLDLKTREVLTLNHEAVLQ